MPRTGKLPPTPPGSACRIGEAPSLDGPDLPLAAAHRVAETISTAPAAPGRIRVFLAKETDGLKGTSYQ
ncbi:hypothetical protein GCM10011578_070280 [Streptomyces fuscichromogenes]|uniref:Uncharacterized protein n=1 Tax=Streptomyces fuscichromogenes TaxID=1324013 RepID=A0A917XJS0_9ACTN|nr:hypothetical protein GCM10011578_070280 [Streptomyces fuscichromogenes]